MPTVSEIATVLTVEMMRKSGVRAWETDTEVRTAITSAALEMAALLGASELMASKFLLDEMDGTPKQMCFADHAGDFSPTAANDLRITTDGSFETDVQMALASLANGSYFQSAKGDLGAVRAPSYSLDGAFEIAATPTAGNVIQAWWAPSRSGTAATANPGGASGSSAAYTGYSSNAAASVRHLDFIGNFVCTAQATATIQVGTFGTLVPKHRYGSLILLNSSGAAFHSDDAEIHLVLSPVFLEGQ